MFAFVSTVTTVSNANIFAHGSHGSHSKFAEGMRRSRINVKKSRQNNDC